jgi:hypothetical protein
MATVKGKREGKSGFLKEYFVDHSDARKDDIDRAWRGAGGEGSISESLIGKVRRDLGLTGGRRSRAKAKGGAGAGKRPSAAPNPKGGRTGTGKATSNSRHATADAGQAVRSRRTGGVLIELEGRIDGMLHEVSLAGGLPEFEEALRKARRILVRSHGG